jgi:hypothetical protein
MAWQPLKAVDGAFEHAETDLTQSGKFEAQRKRPILGPVEVEWAVSRRQDIAPHREACPVIEGRG